MAEAEGGWGPVMALPYVTQFGSLALGLIVLASLCSWRVFVPGLPNYVNIPSYHPPVRRNPNRPE